jgi:hypothetical protein
MSKDEAIKMAQKLKNSYPTGNIILEVSNEVWNWIYPQTNWLGNNIPPELVIRDSNGNIVSHASANQLQKIATYYAQKNLDAWDAFESVFGRSRIIRTYAGQAAWFDALAG